MSQRGIDAALAEVARARRGRRTAAYFDFDCTLIDGYSALAALGHRTRRRDLSPLELARLLWVGVEAGAGQAEFEDFMRVAVEGFRGRLAENLDEMGEALLRNDLGGALYPEAWRLVAAHRRRGHTVVVASSALPFQVQPLAREMGIEHVLCTRLSARDGVLTGEVEGPILWGEGKADAIRRFASEHGVDLGRSFAYGNGDEDVAYLEAVGRPRPVNPGSTLARVAAQRGWPVTSFAPRGRPGPRTIARTLAAYGGMAGAAGIGLGIGLLNRSRRDAVNLTISAGSDAALLLAGVGVRVRGREHLWSRRPAVFIFNHQSWLDGLVVMKLLREDITGVAKKEIASQPGFGQFAKLARMAFVDRENGARGREALAPAVERLHEGYSIVIAPEGTRSATPRVGAFKKGAFHAAMQGGVPIVPMVIRGAGELLWRGSSFMRSGTVDVRVLAPIFTDQWTADSLNERVAEVRERFVETLADWEVAA